MSTASLVRKGRLGNTEDLCGKSATAFYLWNETFGNDLITSDYSRAYRFQRRVFKTAMHVFGSGIEQTTERVGHAVHTVMKEIDGKEGRQFSPRGLLESSILIQLWDWLTSTELELDDPLIHQYTEFNKILATQALLSAVHHFIPIFSYLPTQANREIDRAKHNRNTIFPEAYHKQKETYTPGVIRNLTDSCIYCYEKEIAKENDKNIGSMDDITSLMADVSFGGKAYFKEFTLGGHYMQKALMSVMGHERCGQ